MMAFNTYHQNLVNDPLENTDKTVHFKCTVCGRFTNFSREGFGTPFASEDYYPDDGDIYWGGGECLPTLTYVPNEDFYGYFTDVELAAITSSPADAARATVFRWQQMSQGMPINHPLIINSLHGLEGLGLLAAGRADEIIAACQPV